MSTSLTHLCCAALIGLAASAALAEEEHRELGAHVHGHGTFNVAIEAGRVSMELEAPGMDIVGFEHAAANPEQQAKLQAAKADLAKPLELFAVPAAAGCTVAQADVELENEQAGAEHDHGDHDHHADHDHDGDDKDHDHDHADAAHGHSHFHVAYALTCAAPEALTAIDFGYFKRFPGAQGLTVNVVSGKGQAKYEVSRDKPVLDLSGVM